MSAIPSVPSAERKAESPVPLRLLPGLSEAAQRAVDVSPAEVVRRWIGNLSDGCRRKYAQACREFMRWALSQENATPEAALEVLVQAGPGASDQLLQGFRDHLLQDRGLATGTVAGMVTGLCSLIGACRQAGLTTWRPERVAPRVERRQDRSGPQRFEVEAIVHHVDQRAAVGDAVAVRDAAILRLLYVAALRRGPEPSSVAENGREDAEVGSDFLPNVPGGTAPAMAQSWPWNSKMHSKPSSASWRPTAGRRTPGHSTNGMSEPWRPGSPPPARAPMSPT